MGAREGGSNARPFVGRQAGPRPWRRLARRRLRAGGYSLRLCRLSDGRVDLGLGAGWLVADYERAGIHYDSAGTRIERLEEAVKVMKGFFSGKPFTFSGKHYSIKDAEGSPSPVQKPHPPFLLGGGGRRMLSLAAREAEIVHLNYNLNEGRINPKLVRTGMAKATEQKLGWVKEAAGERFDSIELGFTVFFANVTDDRESLAAAMAPSMGFEPRDVDRRGPSRAS
ncbi:MAG: LLM class flavin-dependent oxidoreductase [Chloroflexi bacterium]|nr:MAG: LLM class flavin-dependent oxidoreductase [Chloroflexota bacterium]